MNALMFNQKMHSALEASGRSASTFEIRSFSTLPSTNTRVTDMLGLYPRVVVTSEVQTQGRGRGTNVWYSPQGGVWVSFGCITDVPVVELSEPIVYALKDYLSKFVDDVEVKLPNDLLISGKKVCGVLVETKIKSNRLKEVIVGIGINVENDIPDEVMDLATRLSDHGDAPALVDLAVDVVITAMDSIGSFIPEFRKD